MYVSAPLMLGTSDIVDLNLELIHTDRVRGVPGLGAPGWAVGSTPARHEQPLQALGSFQAGSVIPLVRHAEVPEEGGTRWEREVPLLHAAQHHWAGTECGGEHATRSSLLQPAAERFTLTVDVGGGGGDLDNNVEHVGQVILLQSAAKRLILPCNDDDVDNIV